MDNRFKPKFNIKKGDKVVVITGDDKDLKKSRKVLEVFPDTSKVLVEGVNIVTKHTKPSAQNTKGGIVKLEAPIHISNVCSGMPKPAVLQKQNAPEKTENLFASLKNQGR